MKGKDAFHRPTEGTEPIRKRAPFYVRLDVSHHPGEDTDPQQIVEAMTSEELEKYPFGHAGRWAMARARVEGDE